MALACYFQKIFNSSGIEAERLRKLEITCSREFLTEEDKSVVGGMREWLSMGLQLASA